MERIVGISGKSGFLGSHLSERLPNAVAIDRSGFVPNGLGLVYDLATYGNMAHHDQDARLIYQANLMRVIESFENIGQETAFVYVSTSSVDRPVQNLYSLSKRAGEEFVKLKAAEGYKTAIVRPYSLTGVGEQPFHLIPRLIDSCLRGTEIPFVGEPVHDFIDVEDFTDALLVVADKAPMNGEVYEVGTGKQYSNDEVRVIVEEVTGKRANIRPVESMRSYDSKEWVANTDAIRSLGWEPRISLRESIESMVSTYGA